MLCRLVINPTTKQPKGTAFVEFEDAAKAKTAADASANGRYGLCLQLQVLTACLILLSHFMHPLSSSSNDVMSS